MSKTTLDLIQELVKSAEIEYNESMYGDNATQNKRDRLFGRLQGLKLAENVVKNESSEQNVIDEFINFIVETYMIEHNNSGMSVNQFFSSNTTKSIHTESIRERAIEKIRRSL